MATTTYPASTIAPTCLLILSFIVVSSLYITHDLMSSSHTGTADCTSCFYLHTEAAAAHHHVTYPVAVPTSRKILMDVPRARARAQDSSERRPNINNEGVEFRNVPSGPDPLHHNGGPQRSP